MTSVLGIIVDSHTIIGCHGATQEHLTGRLWVQGLPSHNNRTNKSQEDTCRS